MSVADHLAVLAAGVGAGVLTSTVGVASLLSFPVLLAVGLPPVVANATNTVGLTPGALSGSWGYRRELRAHPRVAGLVLLTGGLGAVAGAALLLLLPGSVFQAVVPWLILFTCALVGVQPRLSAWLRSRRDDDEERHHLGAGTLALALLTGVYGGYFGAGAGVMMLAVLGLGTDLDLKILNALKTLAVLASNVVASLVFVVAAHLAWLDVGLLAAGSLVGGYAGAHLGRRLPPTLLRGAIVVAGITAAVLMLLRR